jgi:hypothetical protein
LAPKPRLLPIPDVPNRRHPAYELTFEAYLRAGGSVARAMRLVEEVWDPLLYGTDPPSVQSVRNWVREDGWQDICRQFANDNRRRIRNMVNTDILLGMGDMLEVMRDIAHNTTPDNAKANSVKLGAVNSWLKLGAAGVQETRMGDLPDHDVDAEEAVHRVRGMSPEQVLEAEMAELEAEA